MTDNEQEQIYSIALTMVPGIGHIGAKRLVEGMKSATDVFRFRKELAQRLSGVHERVHWTVRQLLSVLNRNLYSCKRIISSA